MFLLLIVPHYGVCDSCGVCEQGGARASSFGRRGWSFVYETLAQSWPSLAQFSLFYYISTKTLHTIMGSSSKLGHDLDFSASFQRKVLAQLVAQFLAILGQPRLFRVIPTKSPGPLLSKTGPKLGQTGPAGPETGPRLIFVLRNGPENWATGPPLAQVCVTKWARLFTLRVNMPRRKTPTHVKSRFAKPPPRVEWEMRVTSSSRGSRRCRTRQTPSRT